PVQSGPFVIAARDQGGRLHEIQVDSAGPYLIPRLFPGAYRLQVYRDSDHDGRLTLGQAFPFMPAERFFVYADSVVLRSRWPNEGNDIILPR
ncbi:hypothetical protein JW992_03340, partial [candidate division KSB1 bacterium]|nr:hypothetical protein [candidate division KSB1 bacterium]